MNKKIFFSLMLVMPIAANAQFKGLFNKIKTKADQKINQRVDSKVDKAIDKTLDDAEGKNTAKAPGSATSIETEANAPVKKDEGIKSFSKYDFVPGDKILYAEDFALEAIAELPAGWNTNGSGEVVSLDNVPGKWLRLHNPFVYLTSNTKDLTQNYTAEFDLILQLKNNGWMYPTFTVGLFATSGEAGTSNTFLKAFDKNASVMATLYPEENNNSRVVVESATEGKIYFKSEARNYGILDKYYGKPVHIAVQVQQQRFRMWINETKVFDVPRAIDTAYKMNQLFFKVGATNYKEEQYGIYITNIKAATGLPDTRHKLIEEGKFSTTGILFDLNSATIKPASYGIIKEIAAVLKENPSVRIKIIGHTSSDGDDKENLELSKKRSAAVKDLLITEYAIDNSAIETDGKGEMQPTADNKTREGKVANRRVEFVKIN